MSKSKKNKKKTVKAPRSFLALSAIINRPSAGPMKDRRMKRQGSKKAQDKRAIEDGWK